MPRPVLTRAESHFGEARFDESRGPLRHPKQQWIEYDKVVGMTKAKATAKVVAKIHDVLGYSKRITFTPRHDETLYPWEIGVKAMN